ncbi:hypothetical protein D9M71_679070 [compost metagenome]
MKLTPPTACRLSICGMNSSRVWAMTWPMPARICPSNQALSVPSGKSAASLSCSAWACSAGAQSSTRPADALTAINPLARATALTSWASSNPRLASAASPWLTPKRTQAALSSVNLDLENTAYFFKSANCGSTSSRAMANKQPSPSSSSRKLDCMRPFWVQRAPRVAVCSLT